ncbi:MAG: hypothetical protein ACREJC_02735, partial [Tepidisphaeraceae bacterium]
MTLTAYFRGEPLSRALAAYAERMADPAWSVTHKMGLYDAAYRAYDPDGSDGDGFAAFTTIYGALRSREWGAFRPLGAAKCWQPRRIYSVIRQKMWDFGPAAGLHLLNFRMHHRATATVAMESLKGIKPTRSYPTMTVSKFLHFYNPGLFPIWDNAVIDHRVFKRFGEDYAHFCVAHSLDPDAVGAEFLGNYVCWGSRCVLDAGKVYMPEFVEWLRDEIPPRRFRLLDPARLATLYAV